MVADTITLLHDAVPDHDQPAVNAEAKQASKPEAKQEGKGSGLQGEEAPAGDAGGMALQVPRRSVDAFTTLRRREDESSQDWGRRVWKAAEACRVAAALGRRSA